MSGIKEDNTKKDEPKKSGSGCNFREFIVVVVLITGVVWFMSNSVGLSSNVKTLHEDDFDAWIKQHDFTLVEFYAPWCVICQEFAEEYENAAKTVKEIGLPVKLAQVDATENMDLADKYQIKDYPTLLWFSKDEGYQPQPYIGGKESDRIVKWINKHSLLKLEVLPSQKSLQDVQQRQVPAIIVLYGDSPAFSILVKQARLFGDLGFYQITNAEEFGEYKEGDIVMYAQHTEPQVTSFTSEDELFQFINDNAYQTVSAFSPSNFKRMAGKAFTIMGVDLIQDDSAKENLISVLNEVAKSRGNMGFLYGDASKLKRGIEDAGASGNVFPTILAINPATNEHFAFDEELDFTVESVGKWLDGLLDGTTKTFRKSEPIPEENDGPVKLLVAKTFDAAIKGKNAVVMYYAPWCPHCQAFTPVYEQVAEQWGDKGILFAKIDPTTNYHEEEINEIPTVVFYQTNGDSHVYSGDRTLDDLSSFVGKHLHSHTEL